MICYFFLLFVDFPRFTESSNEIKITRYIHKYYRISLEEKASFSKVHKIQKLVGLRHHRQHSTNSNNSLIKMLRSLGTAFISISFIIILFCEISDGVQKIRYRKIQNPKSNGLFGGDSTADIYGFLNRISPPHGKFLNFFGLSNSRIFFRRNEIWIAWSSIIYNTINNDDYNNNNHNKA